MFFDGLARKNKKLKPVKLHNQIQISPVQTPSLWEMLWCNRQHAGLQAKGPGLKPGWVNVAGSSETHFTLIISLHPGPSCSNHK